MRQGEPFGLRLHGKLCGELRIHVRPGIGLLSAEERTFRDKQVGVGGEDFGVPPEAWSILTNHTPLMA